MTSSSSADLRLLPLLLARGLGGIALVAGMFGAVRILAHAPGIVSGDATAPLAAAMVGAGVFVAASLLLAGQRHGQDETLLRRGRRNAWAGLLLLTGIGAAAALLLG